MKKKILIGCIIVVILAAFVTFSIMKNSSSSPVFGGGKTYEVKAAKVEKGEISAFVSADGTTQEIEKMEVYFDTLLKVVKLLVENNQKVSKGQKLLELDMDSLYSELEKLKINRATEILALDSTTMDAEVKQAEYNFENSERAYNEAKKNYEKNKALYDANAISKNDFELSEKAYLDAEAALDNARTAYRSSLSSKSLDAKTKEQNLKITELSISDLEKKIQKLNAVMVSPIDGIVTDLKLEVGAFTSDLGPAFKIINIDKLQVKANVSEYDIKNVKAGQPVKITGDAIPKDANVTGKVKSVSPVAVVNSTSSGEEVVVEVIVEIENSDVGLRPGLNVTCDISTIDRKDVLIAPMEMFDEDKDGNKFAYVVNPGSNTMHKKPVILGISSDMNVEVLEGLNAGDLVVLNPQPNFKDGARVKISNEDKK